MSLLCFSIERMGPERWNRIERLFLQAVEMPASQREKFLTEACSDDEALRRELDSLLACDVPQTPLVKGSFHAGPSVLTDTALEVSSDMAGRRIGPYRLLQLLGSGGMGSVYMAVRDDDQFQKDVAIKLLKRGMDTDFMLQRFRQERQILANLDHPFIARLLDGGATDDGLPYFAMEYVDGLPITKYGSERGLDLPERLRLFRLVCEAVQYAHQNLVIHRDLKPSNILITRERIPKLLDFGIAKLISPERPAEMPTITGPEHRMLTPNYASPEQFLGQKISTSSDIYSLGLVLYELLTGQPAHRFTFDSPAAMEKTICEEEPEKPSLAVARSETVPRMKRQRSRELSGDLDNILLTALRKEPQRRYPSVSELSEDIRRHMEGLPVTAREDRLTYRLGKFVKRNRLAVGAVALVIATLTGGIVSTTFQARRAERRFEVARQLAKSVLAEVNGPMARLSGSTASRASIIQTVVRYLDSLAENPGRDPAFDLEIADAYQEVARVEAHPFRQNLGQPSAALEHYQKAIAIYTRVSKKVATSPETKVHALSGLVAANVEAGDVETRAGNTAAALMRLQNVDVLASKAAAGNPSALNSSAWCSLYSKLGGLEQRSGTPQRALAYFRKMLDIGMKWDATAPSVESRTNLRAAYTDVAGAQLLAGDLYSARENYVIALKTVEEALRQPDANVYERSMLSAAHQNLGDVLGNPDDLNFGDRLGAIAHYRAAVAIDEALAAADPHDVRAQDGLADTYRGLGAILLEDQPKEALTSYTKALEISQSLSAAEPTSAKYRSDAGLAQIGIGEGLFKLRKNQEALQKLTPTLELMRSLSASAPGQLSLIVDVGRAHRDIGDVLLARGDEKNALENYQKALTATAHLIQQVPSNLYFQRHHGDSLESLGRYYLLLAARHPGFKDEARSWLGQSLALWQDWTQRNVAAPYAASRQTRVVRYLASCDRLR